MEKLQITFFHNEGKYRPIARIVEVENLQDYTDNKAKYQTKAILSICHTMHITPQEFKKNGYTKIKADLVTNIEYKKKVRALQKAFEKYQKRLDK